MEIIQLIKNLEASDCFKAWKKQHKDAILMYLYNMVEDHKFRDWNIGYYSNTSRKITVFEKKVAKFGIIEECDPAESAEPIKAIDTPKIAVDTMQAMETAFKLAKEEYPNNSSQKIVVILQNLAMGQLWNLTLVGKSFDILNIKIDANSGKILEHSSKPFIQFSGQAS
ncbi:MAG: hypothetical protein ABIG95_03070 [Candidatus Woesearchaeota archaeon]